MKRNAKIILIVLVVVAAILGAIYVLAASVYTAPEVTLVYPEGRLADNYMDAAMYKYTKNDALPNHYSFVNVPYKLDVPDASAAPVGNGVICQIQKDYVLYLTEYSDPATPQAVVQKEFPQVLLINALPAATEIVAMQDQTGKLNGFNAEYIADHLTVSDGVKKQEAALFGYQLNCENEYAGRHIFIAVGTTVMEQEAFDKSAAYLYTVMKTIQFDKSKDAELVESMQAQDLATEDGASDNDTRDTSSQDTAEQEKEPAATGIISGMVDVDQDYSVLTVTVSWANSVEPTSIVLELFSPDGCTFWSPVEKEATQATFIVQNAVAGSYKLNVKGSDTGDVNVNWNGE